MERYVVDKATCAKFAEFKAQLEICDASGEVLGYFLPAVPHSDYDLYVPEFDEDELDRRAAQGGGRTLAEIMADLEKRT